MKRVIFTLAILMLIFFLSCAPKSEPSRTIAPATLDKASNAMEETLEGKWEKLIKAGQKEGRVVVLTSSAGQVRLRLGEAFKKQYGIELEMISGIGGELVQKLMTEHKAGLYLKDIYMAGSTTTITVLKPAGMLDPMEPAFILPELTEPEKIRNTWRDGKLRWLEKDHLVLAMVAYIAPGLAINTDLVKTGEIDSWRDLLNPKWKGKIILQDPTVPGWGQRLMTNVGSQLMGWDYVQALTRQDLVILRDSRLMAEWLAHGKYAITIGGLLPIYVEFMEMGAPIKSFVPKEGTYLTSSNGAIALINKAAHPNAAKLFLNWLLTKEGQAIYSQAEGSSSSRLDVSTEGLIPETIPKAGVKYAIADDEEALAREAETRKRVIDIFMPLLK